MHFDHPPTTQQILAARPETQRPRPGKKSLGITCEQEASTVEGRPLDVATMLLRGSECSFRCTMCDLWKHTHVEPTPAGNIPAQIEQGIIELRSTEACLPKWIKLYNASNFFAARNVPHEDLSSIAEKLTEFERVIVENHPKIHNQHILEFQQMLPGKLEVAMGLETVHPVVFERLNKGMQLHDFTRACEQLQAWDIDIRAFILLRPPWLGEQEAIDWCHKSIDFAESCRIRHVSVVPTRGGNGILEDLARKKSFTPPLARSLEQVFNTQMHRSDRDTIVTPDLWDWNLLQGTCQHCSSLRKENLMQASLGQKPSLMAQDFVATNVMAKEEKCDCAKLNE